jgi:hypothetical protein
MKKMVFLLFLLSMIACAYHGKAEYTDDQGVFDLHSVARYEINVETDLPQGFTLVEKLDKGFYILKFRGNYFLTQMVRTYYGRQIDLTTIDYKGE